MSRTYARTLGEQAYNEHLRQIDPMHMNPRLPQWPHHLTTAQLRHWHTAVGPSLRATKPHFKSVAIEKIWSYQPGISVVVPGLTVFKEVDILGVTITGDQIELKCNGCKIRKPYGTRLWIRIPD